MEPIWCFDLNENVLFLGNGGSLWTDGGEVHLNGLISEIELRTGSEVDSIRAKESRLFEKENNL